MAISSTVVAKLGGNVEHVALNGGESRMFSVTLPSGTWLIECGFYSSSSSSATQPTIGGKIVGQCPPKGGGTATMVTTGGTVSFSGDVNIRWVTGVAIKLA